MALGTLGLLLAGVGVTRGKRGGETTGTVDCNVHCAFIACKTPKMLNE